jgi:putative Mn2+ efflux pump MntP
MLALLLLAVALGLSNFAAAIGIGVSGVRGGTRVRMAVVFGVFEAGMPVLGLVLGRGVADGIGQAARWLGGAALIAFGAFGAFGLIQGWRGGGDRAGPGGRGGAEPAEPGGPGRAVPEGWPMGRLLVSGLVLSGDNLAAGFALGAYHVGVGVAAAAFGVVSVVMSLAGLELGARIGAAAGERAELVAGVILVAAGAAIAAGALLIPRHAAWMPRSGRWSTLQNKVRLRHVAPADAMPAPPKSGISDKSGGSWGRSRPDRLLCALSPRYPGGFYTRSFGCRLAT